MEEGRRQRDDRGGNRLGIAQDIGGLAQGAGEILLNALLVLAGAIFFAVDPKVYERGFLLLVPPAKRAAVEDALARRGQFVDTHAA